MKNIIDSFNTCAEGIMPIIKDVATTDVHAIQWINFMEEEKYVQCFPKNVLEYGEQINGSKHLKVILVNGSNNQNLNSALLLLKRYQAVNRDSAYTNKDLDCVPSMLMFDIQHGAKLKVETQLKRASNQINSDRGWIITGIPCKYEEEPELNAVIDFLCRDFEFGSFICVTKDEYFTETVQRLIYEGEYETIFLQKEDMNEVIGRANALFCEPAIRNSVMRHPSNWEKITENFYDDNPYLLRQGIAQVDEAVKQLVKLRGRYFKECDLITLYETAYMKNITLMQALYKETEETFDELIKGNDFEVIKKLAQKRVAILKAAKYNPKLGDNGQNLLFVGNPGTGKTEGASLFYKLLQAAGCVDGRLVIASRSDIVGSYVGHTAPKVKELFDAARDGVLFVDEAGFFLQKNTGGFTIEAIKEFTRYMSTRRDVSVIFAVYPDEQEAFLALDSGLSSRINHIVKFEDLSNERLCDIGESMLEAKGYSFGTGCRAIMSDYIERMRKSFPDSFGNVREVRRIVEAAVQEAEYRKALNAEECDAETTEVSAEDLKLVTEEMLKSSVKEGPASIGFCSNVVGRISTGLAS